MKKTFYTLSLSILSLLISCKKESKEKKTIFDFVKTYSGKIDNKYPLHIKLKSENNKINGTYFYDKIGQNIEVKGVISNDSTVTLNEFDKKGNQTGLWKGKIINENKIKGIWSKPNGDLSKPFTLILTSDNYENLKEIKLESNNLIRTGKHNFTLQWIGWDYPGSVMIEKINKNTYSIRGQQLSNQNNDYVKINGTLTPATKKKLIFNGTINYLVSHNNNGKECIKSGKQIFKASGNRKYWRLQDMINCEGGRLTDYIDIYFE